MALEILAPTPPHHEPRLPLTPRPAPGYETHTAVALAATTTTTTTTTTTAEAGAAAATIRTAATTTEPTKSQGQITSYLVSYNSCFAVLLFSPVLPQKHSAENERVKRTSPRFPHFLEKKTAGSTAAVRTTTKVRAAAAAKESCKK